MKNLEELGKRYIELKDDLLHGGYCGDFFVEQILQIMKEEVIEDLGNNPSEKDIMEMFSNFFYLGQVFHNEPEFK